MRCIRILSLAGALLRLVACRCRDCCWILWPWGCGSLRPRAVIGAAGPGRRTRRDGTWPRCVLGLGRRTSGNGGADLRLGKCLLDPGTLARAVSAAGAVASTWRCSPQARFEPRRSARRARCEPRRCQIWTLAREMIMASDLGTLTHSAPDRPSRNFVTHTDEICPSRNQTPIEFVADSEGARVAGQQ